MLSLQPATFEEFEREAARGNVVPVVRAVLADLQTPVGAFQRVAEGEEFAFLLESVEGGERVARYSFLGAGPELVVRGRGASVVVAGRGDGGEARGGTNAFEFLREHFAGRRLAEREGLSPFAGGAVGFMAYDAARWFEPTLGAAQDSPEDEAVFMLFRTTLAFDRVRQRIEITSVVFTDDAGGDRRRLRGLYDGAVRETARVEEILFGARPARGVRPGSPGAAPTPEFVSHWNRAGFERAVESIKEKILAGDCY
ncbi:MAG: hypothetical protein LC800_04220, partial [Acidobacteria bacterium]|nr:hypothetical protein [Acidobacteriota bacterium]